MTDIVKCGPVIIGAGVIGLAVAAELSLRYENVVILEAEGGPGFHTSSRNSEVIHSGIYYTQGSLKSRLCLEGKILLYEFLDKYNLEYKRCGKIIAAVDDEVAELDRLHANATSIGLEVHGLDKRTLAKKEPLLRATAALFIPDTGFCDTHSFMVTLAKLAKYRNASIIYHANVTDISELGDGFSITVEGHDFTIHTDTIINSAGLYADRVAALAGYKDYKIEFYKGEYYKCNFLKNVSSLIYSVPPANKLSLGIHTRHYLDGTIGFGPNAYRVSDIDYSIDDKNRDEFVRDIRKYLNVDFDPNDIWPDYTGIRPKVGGGQIGADFLIKKEECTGNRAMINMIGIESPGLTCSLSIAKYVSNLLV